MSGRECAHILQAVKIFWIWTEEKSGQIKDFISLHNTNLQEGMKEQGSDLKKKSFARK